MSTKVKRWEREPRRYNGKCKRGCGAKKSALIVAITEVYDAAEYRGKFLVADDGAAYPFRDGDAMHACECGRHVPLAPVNGKLNPSKECNDRCMAAIGLSCDCACGGINHGVNA